MGMSYLVIAEKETECNLSFPDQLSAFFEQIGGFEEKSEVVQVSEILGIDLSIFQNYGDEYAEPSEQDKFWIGCSLLLNIANDFIGKIEATPTFHEKVIHDNSFGKRSDQMNQMFNSSNPEQILDFLKQQQKNQHYGYPPDHGYLSEGGLLRDMISFKEMMECLIKNGNQKIKFVYI